MSSHHRVRLAAVGDESDMILLNRTLLSNCNLLDETDDQPALSLSRLYQMVQEQVHREEGEKTSFTYSMIAPFPFGSSLPGGSYLLLELDQGLWAALITYESQVGFQTQDWLQLHKACNRLPMFALYSGESFYQEKGEVSFSGGQVIENWDRMAEIWFWLNTGYEKSLPPEEMPKALKRIEQILRSEEWDQSVDELLQNCLNNQLLCEKGLQIHAGQLASCIETHDWPRLYNLRACIADSILWDAQRNPRHIACLNEALAVLNESAQET